MCFVHSGKTEIGRIIKAMPTSRSEATLIMQRDGKWSRKSRILPTKKEYKVQEQPTKIDISLQLGQWGIGEGRVLRTKDNSETRTVSFLWAKV